MTITYTGIAEIKHINLRKEGATEDKTLAADIKIAFVTDSEFVIPFNSALRSLLWNENGAVRIPAMEPVAMDGKIPGLSVSLAHKAVEFRQAEGKKFLFEPMQGYRVGVSMSLAVSPEPRQTGALANLLGESIMVEIYPQADLFSTRTEQIDSTITSDDAMAGVRRAVENLRDMADRTGTTLTLQTHGMKPVVIEPRDPAAKKSALPKAQKK